MLALPMLSVHITRKSCFHSLGITRKIDLATLVAWLRVVRLNFSSFGQTISTARDRYKYFAKKHRCRSSIFPWKCYKTNQPSHWLSMHGGEGVLGSIHGAGI
uniref:Uncharacterized protein n=1 Tax=Cacopsylla melanoneura TaxID=428564 RepID=A0A8D8XCY4_9HEMI